MLLPKGVTFLAAIISFLPSTTAIWAQTLSVEVNPQELVGKGIYALNDQNPMCIIKAVVFSPQGQIEAYECSGGSLGPSTTRLFANQFRMVFGQDGLRLKLNTDFINFEKK